MTPYTPVSFHQKLYQQIDELPLEQPDLELQLISSWKYYEIKAINTFMELPSLLKRYVDDTFETLKKIHVAAFLQHQNSQHNVKCTEL